eukprot:7458989-Prorocentrum_lima.AAC.1
MRFKKRSVNKAGVVRMKTALAISKQVGVDPLVDKELQAEGVRVHAARSGASDVGSSVKE